MITIFSIIILCVLLGGSVLLVKGIKRQFEYEARQIYMIRTGKRIVTTNDEKIFKIWFNQYNEKEGIPEIALAAIVTLYIVIVLLLVTGFILCY